MRLKTINIIPFFTNYGYKVNLQQGPAKVDIPTVRVKTKKLYSLYTILRNKLSFTKKRIKTHYNKYKIKGPPLKEGDKVYLFKCYIYIRKLNNKFDFKKLGLFKIKRKILTFNYKFKLLNSI